MNVSSHKYKILIAEDVAPLALRMRHALENRGYEVMVVTDGVECLRVAAEIKPDLLILDLLMPKMNGIDVLKKIRGSQEIPDLAVMVCTAKDFSTEMKQVKEFGVVDVLIKPFKHDALVEKVDRYFGRD